MLQTKEQGWNLLKQINEEEISNLHEKIIQSNDSKDPNIRIRMEAWIEKIWEAFNKDLEELKNKQTEMNNTITEMKNTLGRINNRITEAEEQICDLEDRMMEFSTAEKNKEREVKRNENSLRGL